jgi:hypothetical protein
MMGTSRIVVDLAQAACYNRCQLDSIYTEKPTEIRHAALRRIQMNADTDRNRKRRNLALIVVFCGLLLVQSAWVRRTLPEPYPAIEMPSFGRAPSASGHMPLRIVTIVVGGEDGSRTSPTVGEFMGDMRFSVTRSALDHAFRGTGEIDPETMDWLRDRAAESMDSGVPAYVEFCWQTGVLDIHEAEPVTLEPCTTRRIEL